VDRFERACAAFDSIHAADPRRIESDGVERPRELVHAERVSTWVTRLEPNASEALRLAARCQHLARWTIPRAEFPAGRTGYLRWRQRLARFHADEAERVLREVGYDEATIEQVRGINLKRGIKRDPDVQTMEDALCLTFLEHEAEEFAARHEPEKVQVVLRKTLAKMSIPGRGVALELALPPALRAAIEIASAALPGNGDA
jgi:hypothetical protein